jgi:hypothetical protein
MTSLAIVLSPDASKLARKLHGLGYALIVVAFVMPFLAASLGRSTAFQAGESLVRNLIALFVFALVAWLATRRRSDMAKALARLLTGVLMCLFVGGHLAVAANGEQQAKQQLQEMLAFTAKQATSFSDLALRFEKVDVNTVLSVENITSPSGLATAKATIAQFRALLAERRLLVQTYLAELDRYLGELPAGDFKAGAMSGIGASKAATVKLYGDLDRSQTAWADTTTAVLDWSTGQSGKLFMRSGQLMFTSVSQKAELTALIDEVGVAEADLNKVLQTTAAAQTAAQEKTKANMQAAEKLLQK